MRPFKTLSWSGKSVKFIALRFQLYAWFYAVLSESRELYVDYVAKNRGEKSSFVVLCSGSCKENETRAKLIPQAVVNGMQIFCDIRMMETNIQKLSSK